tara:strand:+ start:194 stop:985 length:792 start_codon:yes stop_codon:yes gene_type:complete
MNTIFQILLLFILASNTHSKYTEDSLSTVSSWAVLDRFCFVPVMDGTDMTIKSNWGKYGKMDFEFYFAKNQRLTLMFFWGDFSEWLTTYQSTYSELSCRERSELAQFKVDLFANETFILSDHNETHYKSAGMQHFFAMRAYYFFITITNCDPDSDGSFLDENNDDGFYYSQGSISVDYKATLTNGNTANSKHFSADEIGIYDATITYFVFYCILAVLASLIGIALKNRRKLHVTVKLLFFSIGMECGGLLFLLINYGNFAESG